MSKAKPYCITWEEVELAWHQVKNNQGAAGVDDQTIAAFESRLDDNLYKLWNRMSSGSYFPSPVKTVVIPKSDGGERQLGIPTVADRVAQMVVKNRLEPLLEPRFHADSYGYRPRKSSLDAVKVTRERCWRYDWVVDLDIKGFFDNIDHHELMKLVHRHCKDAWIILYIERWLTAPAQAKDGQLTPRAKGTPQGGVISPLLANLFLHYAFDRFMAANLPGNPFARFADDAVVHCNSEEEAIAVKEAIAARLSKCGLELHPIKTRIVYCRDGKRRGRSEHEKFDFLGYGFQARKAKNRRTGKYFCNFLPAISDKASKKIRATIRSWKLHQRSDLSLEEIANLINPSIRGWMAYYGKFYESNLDAVLWQIDRTLARWAQRKYKNLKRRRQAASDMITRITKANHALFAHWRPPRQAASTVGAV